MQQYQDFDDVNFQYNPQYQTEQENLMIFLYIGFSLVTVGTVYYFRDSIKSFFGSQSPETAEQKAAREKAEAEKKHKAKIAEYVALARSKSEHGDKKDAELYQHILDSADYDTNGPLDILLKKMIKDLEGGQQKDKEQDNKIDNLNKVSAADRQSIEELLYSNPNFNADLLLIHNVGQEISKRDATLMVKENKNALETLIDFTNIPSAHITNTNSNDLSNALVTLQKALLSNFSFNPIKEISLAKAFAILKKTAKGILTYYEIDNAMTLLEDSSIQAEAERTNITTITSAVNKLLEAFDKADKGDNDKKILEFKKLYAGSTHIARAFKTKVTQDIEDRKLETAANSPLDIPNSANYFEPTAPLGDTTIARLDPNKGAILLKYKDSLLSMSVSEWKKIMANDLETDTTGDYVNNALKKMSTKLKKESADLIDKIMNLASNRQKSLESKVGKSLNHFETSRMSMLKESARMLSSALSHHNAAVITPAEKNILDTALNDIVSILSNIKSFCVDADALRLTNAVLAVKATHRYLGTAFDPAHVPVFVKSLTELNQAITSLNVKQ